MKGSGNHRASIESFFTETGPTEESKKLFKWLTKAEHNAGASSNLTLEQFRQVRQELLDLGSPATHAKYHMDNGTTYMPKKRWNDVISGKIPILRPGSTGSSYAL